MPFLMSEYTLHHAGTVTHASPRSHERQTPLCSACFALFFCFSPLSFTPFVLSPTLFKHLVCSD